MLIALAVRNVLRNLSRFAPMMISLIIVFILLIMGNAVLNRTIEALYGVYANNITGDLTVSAVSEENFTVFGSDQLLVGQYLIPPTIADISGLKKIIEDDEAVNMCAGLISSAARVEIGKQKKNATVFGVNFEEYLELVPGLQLEAGFFPEPGKPGIVIQARGWKNAKELIGQDALLAAVLGRTFTLREVPITGVISYPVEDSMIENIVLVDADTARALNGYLHGDVENIALSEKDQGDLDSEIDGLFDSDFEPIEDVTEDSETIDPALLFDNEKRESILNTEEERIKGEDNLSWNFLLISLRNSNDSKKSVKKLTAAGIDEDKGYLIRDWSASVGGSAQIAFFLQLLFNIGLLFVSCGAVIIAMNALMLSVLERTGEIGTLRAMGASKNRIAVMIFFETLLVVFGSALVGIIIGKLGIDRLNSSELIIDNPYIKILFGGKPIRGAISSRLVMVHLVIALIFTAISMLYPLKRALSIQPVEAMAE